MIGTLYIHTDEYYCEIVKKCLTQQELADMAGISRQYVTDIENSRRCKHIIIDELKNLSN